MSWLRRLLNGWDGDSQPQFCVPTGDPERIAQVQDVLAELRPMFHADGGDVELVSVEGGQVNVRFHGACTHCTVSDTTLHGALGPRLKERHPWVEDVRAL